MESDNGFGNQFVPAPSKKAWGKPSNTIVKVLNEAGLEQTVNDIISDVKNVSMENNVRKAASSPERREKAKVESAHRQSAWGKPPSESTVMNILSRVEFLDGGSDDDAEEIKPISRGKKIK